MPKIKCNYCGKEIWRKPYLIKHFKHLFCSRECKAKWESENLNGKNSHRYKKVEVKCKWCGAKFEIKPSRIKQGRGKFCSLDCQSKWQAENFKKENNPFYGKHHAKETIERVSLRNKENGLYSRMSKRMKINNPMKKPEIVKKVNKTCKERGVYAKYGLRMKIKNPMKEIETKRKVAKAIQKLWQNPEYVKKVMKSLQKRPTKSELILDKIIHKITSEFKYNGDFSQGMVIGGRIPDWINCNGKKQVIEMFGVAFHSSLIRKDISYWKTEPGTIQHYKKYGFNCLVVWDYELKNLTEVEEKIKNFLTFQNINNATFPNNETIAIVK
jgi:G:T-mismatch repair DNA endonuclease (very short patch repair protein)